MPTERSPLRAERARWACGAFTDVPRSFLGFGDLLRHQFSQLLVAKAG